MGERGGGRGEERGERGERGWMGRRVRMEGFRGDAVTAAKLDIKISFLRFHNLSS